MLIDARDLPAGTVLQTDVCIVGAGAAGITMARRLSGRGRRVLLLESGGFEADPATSALASGDLVGEPMGFFGAQPPLETMRLRYFGGSTNHWGGWCHPLERHDFERREHVPDSGWPFDLAHLEPFYEEAQRVCQLGVYRYDLAWWGEQGAGEAVLETDRLGTTVMQLSPPTRFGEVYRDELVAATDVEVCLWANVVDLDLEGDRVTAAEVVVLDGDPFRVEATTFVLATGGVDVPRLLLACTRDRPAGIGNHNDLVGRYFADHPHLNCRVALNATGHDLRLYAVVGTELDDPDIPAPAATSAAVIAQPEVAAAEGLPGFGALFNGMAPEDEAEVTSDDVGGLAAAIAGGMPTTVGMLAVRAEQRPNRDSRVRLGRGRDATGLRVAEVDWRLGADDRAGFARIVDLVADEWGRAGLGRVKTAEEGELVADRTVDIGCHHMGTARMHTDENHGVVDPDCRVYGTANLYVAGSAVFPTYGWVNPTLTIVALAVRLADHLAQGAGT
jgi:choline dehydrogenase-like flavoprotein